MSLEIKDDFKRGLDDHALSNVKTFLNSDVGHMIVTDPNFQICIRNNYINVYWNGCSILKYSPLEKEDKQYLIHAKYIDNNGGETYVPMKFNGNDLLRTEKSFIKDIIKKPQEQLLKYIEKSGKKSGEKKHLATYLTSSMPKPFVLDLEVAFARRREPSEILGSKRKYVANRIDLAQIDDNLRLRLIEVKIDYDSRLKSKEEGKQEVVRQMSYYQDFINSEGTRKNKIIESYKLIAKNYMDLGLCHKFPDIGNKNSEQVLNEFAKNGTLDPNPYLLIVETGKNWKGRYGNHLEKLKNEFKKHSYKPPQFWSAVAKTLINN